MLERLEQRIQARDDEYDSLICLILAQRKGRFESSATPMSSGRLGDPAAVLLFVNTTMRGDGSRRYG